VPGRFQAAVEILFEMVDKRGQGIVHNAESRKLVAPLAPDRVRRIFLLNAMDLLPVDILPWIWGKIYGRAGHDAEARLPARRARPPTSRSRWRCRSACCCLCLFYSVKIKGLGGFLHELLRRLLSAPSS
jgi:F-type H+-transporting ATPase subunit a